MNSFSDPKLLNRAPVLVLDSNFSVTDWNQNAENLFGWTRPEALGKNAHELLQTEFAQPLEQVMHQLINDGEWKGEVICSHKNGKKIRLSNHWILQHDDQGGILAIYEFYQDISPYKGENALRESEARYRGLFENSVMGISQTLPDGRLIAANAAFAQMYGYPNPHELLAEVSSVGQQLYANPKDREEILTILKEKGVMAPRELAVVHRDGTGFYVLVGAREVRDSQGQVYCYQAEQIDITERKQTEVALRESEARLNAAQHIAQIGSWEWDVRTDMAFWSAETFRIFGRNPDALNEHRQNFIDMLHPDDRERVNQALEDAINSGKEYDLEFRVLRPDQTLRIIHSRAEIVSDVNGNPYLLRGTVHDITERKQAEERVQQAHRFAQNTIDAISAHICVLDEHGVILAVNKAWRKFADDNPPIPTNYCIGMNYLDVCDKASGPNSAEAIPFATGLRAVIKGDIDGFVMEYPCHNSGQEKRWFSARITHFAKGSPLRIVITHQNITDRKLAELKVREYTDQLHSLSQRQTELQENERRSIARELHDEVGQVMTAVKTNLETIRLAPEPETIDQQLVDSIGIVDRALDQIRTLALNLRPSLLDDFGLEPTLEWYLERQTRGGQYKINFSSNMAGIRFPSAIETTCFRVVQATMTNISRHSNATRVDVKLYWNAKSHQINLSVRDNGEGFNVNAALEKARHGESLGLLGMQERVHLVGGQIEFKSTPGLGTEVRVKIREDKREVEG